MVEHARWTIPEIAARYGRSARTVETWVADPAWPASVGRRGRRPEYDAHAVARAVADRYGLAPPEDLDAPADDDPLLTGRQAADRAHVGYGTWRGYASRGYAPAPDDETDGVKRWRTSTVDRWAATRRPYPPNR